MMQIKDNLPENKEKRFLSSEFKQFLLLEFTKQLILNSAPMEVLKLREVIDEKKYVDESKIKREREKIKEHVKEVIEEEMPYEKSLMVKSQGFEKLQSLEKIEKQWTTPKIKKRTHTFEEPRNLRLMIPEPNLPVYLRYLRPTPTNREIDLGELNPLIKDPFVKTIECLGPDSNIIVRGQMGEKPTSIILNENQIGEVIQKFSQESKIPVQEGIYKVAVGKLIFMAIVSEVIGSKFIINKMFYQRNNLMPMRR